MDLMGTKKMQGYDFWYFKRNQDYTVAKHIFFLALLTQTNDTVNPVIPNLVMPLRNTMSAPMLTVSVTPPSLHQ